MIINKPGFCEKNLKKEEKMEMRKKKEKKRRKVNRKHKIQISVIQGTTKQ